MIRYLPAFFLLALVAGCEKPQTLPPGMTADQVASYRSELLLTTEPADAKTVIEVRDALKPANEEATGDASAEKSAAGGDGESASAEVTVVGVIGAMPNPYGSDTMPEFPWIDGQATFSLVDPTTRAEFAGEEHQHAEGEECMFCAAKARKLADTVALVTFVDDQDQPIPARSDMLLGLKEGTEVVVTGTGSVNLGKLRVTADGVFVKPQ